MKRNILSAIAALVLCVDNAYTQEDRLRAIVHAGGMFPVGNFAEPIGKYAEVTRRFGFLPGEHVGLASLGGAAGVQLNTPVLTDGMEWTIGVHALVNPTNVSEINAFFRHALGDTVRVLFEYGEWLNVPIFTGFQYTYDIMEDLALFGSVEGGLNLTQQASRTAIVNGDVVESTTFKFMPDFGFSIGLGIEFMRSYSLAVRYYDLGMPRYEGIRTLNEKFFTTIPRREMNVDGDERQVEMIVLMLGYTL